MTTVQDLLPQLTRLAASVNWFDALKTAVVVVGAVLLLGAVLRLFFGRESSVVRAVSACLSIGLVYLAAVLIYAFIPTLRELIPPLPFLLVSDVDMALLDFRVMPESSLWTAMLQLYLLACLTNCLESFLPKGEKLVSWYLLRLSTVAAALGLYSLLYRLIEALAPQVFGQWAGAILAVCWGLILLTGLFKLFLTVALSVVNPILGAVYGFFFANLFGKQLPKSILTTLLTALIITLLCGQGFQYFAFSGFSLAAYAPACVIAFAALYIFGKFL